MTIEIIHTKPIVKTLNDQYQYSIIWSKNNIEQVNRNTETNGGLRKNEEGVRPFGRRDQKM